ncbi:MAG: hypothetical protein KAT16_09075, partial [Candidatus Heimdallarchaeota archaeon]|nr:hypothetical protein [Candidatus Heimdallarchaeota archaeon]
MKRITTKFSIKLETDKGLEEILNFLRQQDVEFAPHDEKRITRRLRLYTRRLGLKNYSELMIRLKEDKKSFEQVFQWLENGRTYHKEDKTYSPLIKRSKFPKKLSNIPIKKMKKKTSKFSIKSFIPPLMLTKTPKDTKNLSLILDFLSKKNINYQAYKQ